MQGNIIQPWKRTKYWHTLQAKTARHKGRTLYHFTYTQGLDEQLKETEDTLVMPDVLGREMRGGC